MLNPAPSPEQRRRKRRWYDLLLFPVALVIVVAEDVCWAAAKSALRWARARLPLHRLEVMLHHLPGWAALPLFLIPEALGKLGELWALALIAGGHFTSGVIAYIVVRIIATLIVVFIYHACEPALLQIRWFAVIMAWLRRLREWVMGAVRPQLDRMRAWMRQRRGGMRARLRAVRVWLRRRDMV